MPSTKGLPSLKKVIREVNRSKYKICVSGAAETGHCSAEALKNAELIGREIAKAGIVLVTGATTGTPYWAAKGAKSEGGFVVGISPATSEAAHIKSYRLPIDYHDMIIYTGFDYSGRNLLLTRSADAIITICGRVGTLNEFTIGFEDNKPAGVLEGSGGAADHIQSWLKELHRGLGKTVFSSDPKELLRLVIGMIDEEKIRE
ncbi:MAG: hypothetical protein FJY91_00335 [Candidatus Harrisonbacteria bacterium]|nr:hypothetical protein [Candidatus Harrisonbacteria bacterium]